MFVLRRVINSNPSRAGKFVAPATTYSTRSVAELEENIEPSLAKNETDKVEKKFPIPRPFLEMTHQDFQRFTKIDRFKEEVNRHDPTFFNRDENEWSDVWPSMAPFSPYLFNLPVRMGFKQNLSTIPDKYANLELLKVQNFLHATPPAIKKHCNELKKFCTEFPKNLRSDQACEQNFPLESHTVDYVAAANNPRNFKARIVTKKIRLCNLALDKHSRIKMKQLLGEERYDPASDFATIRVDRCPLKKQNSDFALYVLTALYFESWKTEHWEKRENMDDYDGYYWWEDSSSYHALKRSLADTDRVNSEGRIRTDLPEVEKYRDAVTNIKLEERTTKLGELNDERTVLIQDYKNSVLKLLSLQK